MNIKRVINTIGMYMNFSGQKRAEYLRKHNVLRNIGTNCMVMFRKIPLYPKLISFGNNVWIASNVSFVTHDVIHRMLNNVDKEGNYTEKTGCIDIKDNVFVGANTTILYDVSIGPNTIIGAGSLVNKSIGSGVYAGIPARYICSFEDYQEKRKCSPVVIPKKIRGELTEDTVKEVWDLFNSENNTDSIIK